MLACADGAHPPSPTGQLLTINSSCWLSPAASGKWWLAHISTLFDIQAMRRHFGERGLEVHTVGGCVGGGVAGEWLGMLVGPGRCARQWRVWAACVGGTASPPHVPAVRPARLAQAALR